VGNFGRALVKRKADMIIPRTTAAKRRLELFLLMEVMEALAPYIFSKTF
jgi:hypothetical protein